MRLAFSLFINSLGLIRCCAKSDETDATLLQHGHSHSAPRPSLVEFDELKSTDSKSKTGLFDGLEKVKTIAWLLTLGDGLHNFLGEFFFGCPSKPTLSKFVFSANNFFEKVLQVLKMPLDGLAIGTAFNQSLDRGIIISVAIACEEFPHELGDFAVLLKSGMSTRQAVFFNFLSAFFCYLGLIVGTIIGQEPEAARVIIAITAGVFLYISVSLNCRL